MLELTEKQKAVVELLAKAARRRLPAPSYREIASALGVDVRGAYQHVEALEKKGVVIRAPGLTGGSGAKARRGIELAPEHAPQPGLPVIGRVAAGTPILAEANVEDYVDLGSTVEAAADDESFLLKVKGDSMVDRHIHDGDFVLVRPVQRLLPGEIGVVAVGSEATVKEVYSSRDRVVLKSCNRERAYPDQIYDRQADVRVVGRVIMAFRYVG